jgi:hypothetical protein
VPAAAWTALLENLIDYAGMFPPASLPLAEAAEKYRVHKRSAERWMLSRIVLPSTELVDPDWRVTLLTEAEPGKLPPQVETLETKQARKFSLPTYCEVPLDQVPAGAFAKIRIPGKTSADLAEFLSRAAVRRLPFKATAGLHHPVRSSERGMHGFVNVFTAAVFAWRGASAQELVDILDEEEPQKLSKRVSRLTASQIAECRREFAHSFGSCSFDEPVDDLRELGWLG